MKKIALLLFFAAATIPSGIRVLGTPGEIGDKKELLRGVWVHRGFYYVFRDSVMTAVKVSGEPKGYKTFKYTIEKFNGVSLLRYGKDITDSTDNDFLLVGDVTDSTAVLAYPTPFIRADSSKGLIGTWKHVEELTAIFLTIGAGTLDYRELVLDSTTGEIRTTVQRHGFYRAGKGKNTGRLFVNFDDDTKTVLLPIVFGDLMYLFDLSPRKSVFLRTDRAPTFRDYQRAVGSGKSGS